MSEPIPAGLAELLEEFSSASRTEKLEMLLELSTELPDLPSRYAEDRDGLEQVHECQSALFLVAEVGPEPEQVVRLYFDAPPEAPTTRGFASLLRHGLDGASATQVLSVPDDFYVRLGLADAVSPLRLRGMAAMLARIKRQVREKSATLPADAGGL
ncbi:MAG: SufE family protein [Actinomycetes bacterium]